MDSDEVKQPPSPWEELGLEAGAGDEQVRAAYIEQVRLHPPDRDQEQFERVRDAYEELRDPRRRAQRLLFSVDPCQPLPSLLSGQAGPRCHVGPGPWLAALRP